jgi:thioredoxin 1
VSDLPAVDDSSFALDVLAATSPVAVDFWAPWCGPCEAVEGELKRLTAELDGRVRLVALNVDENPVTATRYGVLSLPTVILFAEGDTRVTIFGAHSREHYEKAFAPFLD